jgi:hypothetical protein
LRLPDNVAALVDVAEPTPVTRPDVPTATTAPAVEETPTPQSGDAGPDLAVFIASDCAPGSEILITVTNAGTVELTREPIEVIVSNDGAVEVQQAYQADMEPGASASLPTGVTAKPETMAVSVVLTDLEDVDPSNNIASCSVSDNSNDNDSVPPPVATQGN